MPDTFDILVVGAGPGGKARGADGDHRAAGMGRNCTHRGCIPTKALPACSRR
jgi:pyruvate/2-oxoglutarate dehydrogenase complex dihydrolipoamide dehydrogenase (E3) component